VPIELEADREVNVTVSAMAPDESRYTPAHQRIRAAALTRETALAQLAEVFEPSSSQFPGRERPRAAAQRTGDISKAIGTQDPRGGTSAEKTLEDRVRAADIRMLEMRHRIANSLQIVGSILQTKARSVESEEAREHLQDVHHRLMALQRCRSN
jgi:two-component sensor histidine kinase